MPKYWGKQIFTDGRFPEVGQKQKTEGKRKKEENTPMTRGWSRRAFFSAFYFSPTSGNLPCVKMCFPNILA